MAVHQYIGARYVPYYYENSLDPTSTEWEPNVNYEALTVVTLPNLHCYISKKFVPDTIGSPALNAEYWLDTGSENAYIEQLQEDLGDVSTLQTTDKSSAVNAINEVFDLINTATRRKAAVFGNSFAAGVNGVQGVYYGIKDLYDDSDLYAGSGTGFLAYTNNTTTFTTLLNSAPADDEVTDVVVLGAVGEDHSMQEYTMTNWIYAMRTAIENFITAAKVKYPNVKKFTYIHCGNHSVFHTASTKTASGFTDYMAEFWVHLLMDECCKTSEMIYGGWAGWDLLLKPSLFQADKVHPTQDGTDIISSNCRAILDGPGMYYKEILFYDSFSAHSSPNYTAPVLVIHRVTPERTFQTQYQGGSSAGGAESFTGVTNWTFADLTVISFLPPIGYYSATGGVLSGQKTANIRAQTKNDNSWIVENFTIDSGTRNPIWKRAAVSGDEILAQRMTRFPGQLVFDHYPLDNHTIL